MFGNSHVGQLAAPAHLPRITGITKVGHTLPRRQMDQHGVYYCWIHAHAKDREEALRQVSLKGFHELDVLRCFLRFAKHEWMGTFRLVVVNAAACWLSTGMPLRHQETPPTDDLTSFLRYSGKSRPCCYELRFVWALDVRNWLALPCQPSQSQLQTPCLPMPRCRSLATRTSHNVISRCQGPAEDLAEAVPLQVACHQCRAAIQLQHKMRQAYLNMTWVIPEAYIHTHIHTQVCV